MEKHSHLGLDDFILRREIIIFGEEDARKQKVIYMGSSLKWLPGFLCQIGNDIDRTMSVLKNSGPFLFVAFHYSFP